MDAKFIATEQPTDRQFLKEDLQNLLVMRPDTIGEVVMLSPVLRTLRESLPNAEITLMTSTSGSQITPLLPWIDDVMVYPALWKDITETSLLNLRKDTAFIESLREQQFSTALIFTDVSQSPWPAAYASYLAGVPYRVGFSEDFHGSALSHFLAPPADELHQAGRNLHLLEAIGIYETGNQMELCIPNDLAKSADELLLDAGSGRPSPILSWRLERG